MMGKYSDADAIVVIEGKEYALYKNGPLSKYPYMVNTSTDIIPQGKQRSLLKAYLLLHGVNIEPWEERGPHWYVRQAIKAAQETASGSISPQLIPVPRTLPSHASTKKTICPLQKKTSNLSTNK